MSGTDIVWSLVGVVTTAAVTVTTVRVRRTRADTDKRTRESAAKTRAVMTASDRSRVVAGRVAKAAVSATALLTVASFVLSYAHLASVAHANGVPGGFRTWMWPGTIDTFIVIGELLILHCALVLVQGVSWWGWGLTVGGSLASIGFNVAGVGPDAALLEYATAAAPPVAALFAFGALMHQVRQHVSAMSAPADTTSDAPDTSGHEVPAVADADTVVVSAPPRPLSAPADTVSAPPVAVMTAADTSGHEPVAVTTPADTTSAVADTVTDITSARVDARTRERNERVAHVSALVSAGKELNSQTVADMYGLTTRSGRRILSLAREKVSA